MDAEVVGELRVLLFRIVPNVLADEAGLGEQLVVVGHGFLMAAGVADPDRERRAPVALAGESPIDVRGEEIAEAAVFDVLGEPIDLGVVGEHLVLELGRFDEPALARVLDERIFFGSPAERVVVDVLFLVEEEAALLEVADDVFVAIFDPAAAAVVGAFVGEFAVGADAVDERRAFAVDEIFLLLREDFVVVFAEGWRDVYEAGAAVGRDEVAGNDSPREWLRSATERLLELAGLVVGLGSNRMAVCSATPSSWSPPIGSVDAICRPFALSAIDLRLNRPPAMTAFVCLVVDRASCI